MFINCNQVTKSYMKQKIVDTKNNITNNRRENIGKITSELKGFIRETKHKKRKNKKRTQKRNFLHISRDIYRHIPRRVYLKLLYYIHSWLRTYTGDYPIPARSSTDIKFLHQ